MRSLLKYSKYITPWSPRCLWIFLLLLLAPFSVQAHSRVNGRRLVIAVGSRCNPKATSPIVASTTSIRDLSILRGGSSKGPRLPLERLSSRANTLLWTKLSSPANSLLWTIPLIVAIVSFGTFRATSRFLFKAIEWTTQQPWLPSTDAQINHQTNVVTQVVNGPVITSISVLFASLVSMTISSLHSRQVDIQRSFIWEVHQLRLLQSLLASQLAKVALSDDDRMQALALVHQYSDCLFSDQSSSSVERSDSTLPALLQWFNQVERRSDPHLYIESTLPALLQWCNQVESEYRVSIHLANRCRRKSLLSPEPVTSDIKSLTHGMLHERGNRCMALLAVHFPMVHYGTLAFLAVSICVAFLVATAQAEVLFLEEGILSVRILWTVLITTFSALGVLCYDLLSPFIGSYLVTEANEIEKRPQSEDKQ
jgi:hypothetical protein